MKEGEDMTAQEVWRGFTLGGMDVPVRGEREEINGRPPSEKRGLSQSQR